MNNYDETIEWIHNLKPFGEKPGLKRMEWLLKRLGNPEKEIKFIHVGGTNGKGSTVSFLRHILTEAGKHVGTFTSPFIERFNERISYDGKPIEDEDLVKIAQKVRSLVEELAQTELGSPTTFEVITTIALVYFADFVEPDIVVMEVGIGGTYDSTNVITPLLSIITNVGYDHMNILGDTIGEIASQKAGIIKPEVPIITAAENKAVIQVFNEEASKKHAPIYSLGKDFNYEDYLSNDRNQSFTLTCAYGKEGFFIKMQGEHQIKNATLAVMAVYLLKKYYSIEIDKEAIKRGLEQTTWLGRFEILQEQPSVIIDGAHNKEGIEALAKTLENNYLDNNIYVIFSATKEKDITELLPPLYKLVTEICFTTFDFPRAASSKGLYNQSSFQAKTENSNWKEAIQSKLCALQKNDILLITGSLYFISEVRNWYINK